MRKWTVWIAFQVEAEERTDAISQIPKLLSDRAFVPVQVMAENTITDMTMHVTPMGIVLINPCEGSRSTDDGN